MTRKHGNRSGKKVSPVLKLQATEDERAAYATCASLTHQPFAAWARDALNAQAKAQGIDPPEKLNDAKAD